MTSRTRKAICVTSLAVRRRSFVVRSFGFLSLFTLSQVASGGAAVRLVLSNDFCLIEPCGPHSPPSRIVAAGTSFGIYVAALDGEGSRDNSYAGRVHFSSTDSLATLPADYTFLPGDQGDRPFSAVLRSPGDQTITVADLGGNVMQGTLVMTVTGAQVAEAIPVLSFEASVLLAVLLGLVGILLVRPRS